MTVSRLGLARITHTSPCRTPGETDGACIRGARLPRRAAIEAAGVRRGGVPGVGGAGRRPYRSRPVGQLRGDGRAGARRALDEQAPVERRDAIGEPAQTGTQPGVRSPDPVVGDLDLRDRPRAPET